VSFVARLAQVALKAAAGALLDLVRSGVSIKPKAPAGPQSVPLSHKTVEHQQAQMKAGARPFPPPRRPRPFR
jgi:hypothetical protein